MRKRTKLGSIFELESAYKDAADAYERAWRITQRGSPSLGYQPSFNYLKAKRYVEAIDVANDVIKRFPTYPGIREDVLEIAMRSLKPNVKEVIKFTPPMCSSS